MILNPALSGVLNLRMFIGFFECVWINPWFWHTKL